MVYDYRHFHYMTRPEQLATHTMQGELRPTKRALFLVFAISFLLFGFRNVYGFGSHTVMHILAQEGEAMYQIARLTSLIGSLVYSGLYVAFIIFGISFIFAAFTEIPYRAFLPLQLIVASLYIADKALLTLLFVMRDEVASLSIFSFGPLAHRWIDNEFIVYFLNQWSIFTILIVLLQYRFIKAIEPNGKRAFVIVIGLHLFMTLIIAGLSLTPFDDLYRSIMGGGVR